MTGTELLAIFEQFQTLIVGVFGFIGVIWTLRSNAKGAREQHRREIETKRHALRRILLAELRNYSRALKKNLEVSKPTNGFISVGRIRRLYSDQLAADIGLLEPGEIDVVLNALISLDGMSHFLENISSHASETRFLLPIDVWDDYQYANSTTSEALEYAVQALELTEND